MAQPRYPQVVVSLPGGGNQPWILALRAQGQLVKAGRAEAVETFMREFLPAAPQDLPMIISRWGLSVSQSRKPVAVQQAAIGRDVARKLGKQVGPDVALAWLSAYWSASPQEREKLPYEWVTII